MSFLELTGAPESADALALIGERSADMQPVWPAVYESFQKGEEQRWDTEGPGWAPLASATLAKKARMGWPENILVATGALRTSLTKSGSPGAVFRPLPTSVEMGTEYRSPTQRGVWADVALGAFHQYGTDHMPARPIIDTSDQYVAEWAPMVADWLRAGVVPQVS